MRKTIVKLTGRALLLAACATVSSAQTIEFFELDPGLVPQDASVTDCVVVGDNVLTGEYFEWTSDGGAVDIGGVTAGGGVGGTPRISDDGQYVGGTSFNGASGLHELSRYDRNSNTWTPLGGIGSSCSTEISSGWGISGDGNHVVGLGWFDACAEAHAMQWTDGGGPNDDLGSSVMGESTRANAVDFDGNVVAGWQDGNGREGCVWIDGVQTVFPGTSEAGAVSNDGNWVVGIGASATNNEAWRWSAGTGVEPLGTLGIPFFPFSRGFATATNADGSLIMGFDRGFGPPTGGEGWMWTEAGGLVPLEDYFTSLGLVLADDVRLSLPLGMSADGLTFCGLGRSETAFSFGWVIKITEPAECFLVIGEGPGDGGFIGDGHHFQTQVGPVIEDSYAVLMQDIPEFVLPTPPSTGRRNTGLFGMGLGDGTDPYADVPSWMLDSTFAVQVLMWNPQVFPGMPEQYTAGLHVTILPHGGVRAIPFGTDLGGLDITYEIDTNAEGQRVIRFPFLIPGF